MLSGMCHYVRKQTFGTSRERRRRVSGAAAVLGGALVCAIISPVAAQQSDLARTHRWFETFQTDQRRAARAPAVPGQTMGPAKADTRPFTTLSGIVIEGAKHVPADLIAATYQPFIGRRVSQADLVQITERITALYRDRGYHLSRAIVPPQDVVGNRILIKVIEGCITEVVLKGPRAEQFGIRPLLAVVTSEDPSRRDTLERQLLLANDIPGVRIADTAIDEIGAGTGRFRLTVWAETWRIFTALDMDNRGTPAVGPLQSYLNANLNSAMIGGDTLGVNVSSTPDDIRELAFGRLYYTAPVGDAGARITASGSYGAIRPGDERSVLDTRSWAETFELRGSVVPLRTREASLWLTGIGTIQEAFEGTAYDISYRDHLRTVGLTVDYQQHDALNGWNYLTFTVRQGIDLWGASRRGDTLLSRDDGAGEFTKLELAYTRYQPLSDVWSVKLSAFGQWASTGLLAVQELYLGSMFGRGYFGVELSGDNGFEAAAELRFDQTLSSEILKGYQLYGFLDGSMVWNFHSIDGAPLSLTLAGAGARLYLPQDLQVGVEAAVPIEYRVTVEPRPDPRLFFYVAKTFKLCPGSAQLRCS
ncbi:ShlB/FhaC/HecB family hemolysin secretion/activation protein [Rhodoplanes sp. SY1]|uniref:ShlB/FhaC/HecB family hemolysin secretion/activation protein n=1 Tax=Rhodoplanes sp. SY1 TaxID=3166646 RepID=UPI0038B56865